MSITSGLLLCNVLQGNLGSRLRFQPGNVPCHGAQMVQKGFEEPKHKLEELIWPPPSPDPPLVEYLWDVLDKQVWSSEASSAANIFVPDTTEHLRGVQALV